MKNRLVFVDLLRGWATIVMIEVHVFNAFILPDLKATAWYGVLNYINGLVAPSFIFVAGFVFVYVSERKIADFRTYGTGFWKQISRISQILAIGYLLHLPYFSWYRTLHETTQEGWEKLYQSDVLHCIAVGLFFVFLTRIKIKSNDTYQRFLLGSGLLVLAATPFAWDVDFYRYVPGPFAAYINGQHFSQFPLFLWIAFMLFGGYYAMDYLKARQANKESEFVRRIGMTGIVLMMGGNLVRLLPVRIPSASVHIRANPFFFAERLGIVLLLLFICWHYAERKKTTKSFVLDVSRESLLVYAAHLLVIYGLFFRDRSLSFLYGGTFTFLESCAATLCLMLVMVVASKVWGWLKHEHMYLARGISVCSILIFLSLYFSR
jgi:uncharacterized membrane protein